MRRLSLLVLVACGSSRPVVIWAGARAGGEERIEVRGNGQVEYTATNNGIDEKPEAMSLMKTQVRELGDMLRSQRACELGHDPAYTPEAEEGQTTLLISFPDQQCKVTLWNGEWLRGRARDIADTMRSMRLRPH